MKDQILALFLVSATDSDDLQLKHKEICNITSFEQLFECDLSYERDSDSELYRLNIDQLKTDIEKLKQFSWLYLEDTDILLNGEANRLKLIFNL